MIIYIAMGIGVIALVIAFVVMGIAISGQNRLKINEETDDRRSLVVDNRLAKLESLKLDSPNATMARGPPGIRGPQGPAGPPGGFYTASGPLINMSNKKVGTPTFGSAEASIIYLDDKNYSPIQYWFLENQKGGGVKIRNKFSDLCLTANSLGDIYSETCSDTNNNQLFNWGRNMQFQSQSFANQCIGLQDFTRSNSNSNNSYNYNNLEVAPNTNVGTVQKLKLEACSASLNPKQTWYVGQ